MNEFEEWWILEGQNIVGHYDQREEELAKVAWAAAIQWANKICRKWVVLHDNVYSDINSELIKLEEK